MRQNKKDINQHNTGKNVVLQQNEKSTKVQEIVAKLSSSKTFY